MIKILVNGDEQEMNDTISIAQLIKSNNVAQPEMVSIQLNGEFVNREDFEIIHVNEGDEIDFLYFMGGGHSHFTNKKLLLQ